MKPVPATIGHSIAPIGPAVSHCVFRSGSLWLALPAAAVREVMPRPDMVCVPGTPKSFVGLCHVRSEFIPVLNLRTVLSGSDESDQQILLILDSVHGAWGILVDEVTSLQSLEVSDAPEIDDGDQTSPVPGWATLGDLVIQVLDHDCIRDIAEQELTRIWQSPHGQPYERSLLPQEANLFSEIDR